MASRKEEKEALRAERERKAAEAAAAEKRRRMIGFGAAGVLVAAAVIAIAVVLLAGGDDKKDGGDGKRGSEPTAGEFPKGTIPARNENLTLEAAAREAKCKVTQHESEGRGHVDGEVKYKTSPPNSGSHNEFASQDGAYAESPPMEQLVHALEHGRVILWFQPNAPAPLRGQLKALFDEDTYHVLLSPNTRDMDATIAASSWTRSITCSEANDKVWDALRLFRDRYRDQAPEQVP